MSALTEVREFEQHLVGELNRMWKRRDHAVPFGAPLDERLAVLDTVRRVARERYQMNLPMGPKGDVS